MCFCLYAGEPVFLSCIDVVCVLLACKYMISVYLCVPEHIMLSLHIIA
jgi:hypothetical protein